MAEGDREVPKIEEATLGYDSKIMSLVNIKNETKCYDHLLKTDETKSPCTPLVQCDESKKWHIPVNDSKDLKQAVVPLCGIPIKSDTIKPKVEVYEIVRNKSEVRSILISENDQDDKKQVLHIPKTELKIVTNHSANKIICLKDELKTEHRNICSKQEYINQLLASRKFELESPNEDMISKKCLHVLISRVKVDPDLMQKTVEYYKQSTIATTFKVKQEVDGLDLCSSSSTDGDTALIKTENYEGSSDNKLLFRPVDPKTELKLEPSNSGDQKLLTNCKKLLISSVNLRNELKLEPCNSDDKKLLTNYKKLINISSVDPKTELKLEPSNSDDKKLLTNLVNLKNESKFEAKLKVDKCIYAEEMQIKNKVSPTVKSEASDLDPDVKPSLERYIDCEDSTRASDDDAWLERDSSTPERLQSNCIQERELEDIPQATVVSKLYSPRTTLKYYHNVHRYKCSHCAKSFKRPQQLLTHTYVHTQRFVCRYCYKPFSGSTILRTHILTHTGEHPFMCQVCGKTFTQNSNLTTHLKIHSSARPYRCNTCKKFFKRKQDFKNHTRKIHSKKRYTCEFCQQTFSDKNILLTHIKTVHLHSESFGCHECGKIFTRKDYLTLHMKVHAKSSEITQSCKVCGKRLRKEYMRTHMRLHAGSKPYKCKCCHATFTQSTHLKIHYRTHSGAYCYFCNECGEGFRHKQSLRMHVQRHDKTSTFDCTICGKSFYSEVNLQNHIRSNHTDSSKWPYSCEVCNKPFYAKNMLVNHMASHEDCRDFKCALCPKMFKYRAGLLHHLKKHTAKKSYCCKSCSAEFSVNSDLAQHQKQHYKDCPYHCNECGIGFKSRNHIIVHCRSHLKNIMCATCGDAFSSKSNLKYHNAVKHSDKSALRYACNVCTKRFPTEKRIRDHEIVHSDSKNFHCNFCELKYKTKNGLFKHIKKHHKNSSPSPVK